MIISQSFEKFTDSALCVALNPKGNGQVLTGGQDNHAYLFNANKPDDVIELCGHEESVCAVCYNTGGDLCATIDMNGIIKVWSSEKGKLVTTIQGPEDPEWLQFHPKVGCGGD